MIRDSKSLVKLIEANGWCRVKAKGGHLQFKHPTKPGRVTIPHPVKDLPRGTVKNIYKQAQIPIED